MKFPSQTHFIQDNPVVSLPLSYQEDSGNLDAGTYVMMPESTANLLLTGSSQPRSTYKLKSNSNLGKRKIVEQFRSTFEFEGRVGRIGLTLNAEAVGSIAHRISSYR